MSRKNHWNELIHLREKWPKLTLGLLCLGLFLFSLNIFLINLDFPNQLYFDEIRYVSAARGFFHASSNSNWTHPPLAKFLIGIGSSLLGDQPLGWRVMSALFGSLTLVSMFLWGMAVFRNLGAALEVACLALASQVLWAHSRIATLDIFMVCFMILGLAAFSWAWLDPKLTQTRRQKLYLGAVVLFGLSTACKWFGVVPLVLCSVLYFFRPEKQRGKKEKPRALLLAGIFLIVYFLTLVPLMGMKHPGHALSLDNFNQLPQTEGTTEALRSYGPGDLIYLQWRMLQAQMEFDKSPGAFRTPVLGWPFMIYPVWLGLGKASPSAPYQWRRALLWLGNPLIFWVGFLSIGICLWAFKRTRSRESLLISSAYLALWLSWLVVPRKVTLSYYYFPAALVLCLAIPFAFRFLKISAPVRLGFLACAVGVMIYFYPLIVGVEISSQTLQQKLWFSTWQRAPENILLGLPRS